MCGRVHVLPGEQAGHCKCPAVLYEILALLTLHCVCLAVRYDMLALLTGHCICPAVLYEILAVLTGHCMGYTLDHVMDLHPYS